MCTMYIIWAFYIITCNSTPNIQMHSMGLLRSMRTYYWCIVIFTHWIIYQNNIVVNKIIISICISRWKEKCSCFNNVSKEGYEICLNYSACSLKYTIYSTCNVRFVPEYFRIQQLWRGNWNIFNWKMDKINGIIHMLTRLSTVVVLRKM